MTKPLPAVPYHATHMEPLPSTSITTNYKPEPLSLEMFNHAATNLNEKGDINLKKYKNTCTNLHIKMDPEMLNNLDPANNFAMGGMPMAMAQALLLEEKLPTTLFLDVMVEKTQILIHHIKNHHLGLCLTANIGANITNIRMYDNFATVNTQLLHVTVTNHSDLENQLWRLYIEVNGIIH